MPNFNYRSQFSYSFCGQRVKLMATVAIGASGAPTIQSNTGMGIASITRNSAGNYTILLTNTFTQLLEVNLKSISPSAPPAAPSNYIVSNSVTNATSPSIVIQTLSGNTPTDPANGETILLSIELDRSSVGH